ncbi:MAG: hypothetical protein ACI9OJ_001141, partial [Myxococcota bacterium]
EPGPIEPVEAAPEDAGPPPVPTTAVRFMLRAPKALKVIERASLRDVRASVSVDGVEIHRDVPVVGLRSARQGIAVLLVTTGQPPGSGQMAFAETLFGSMGPHDRVAVGALLPAGFQLARSFSADIRSAAPTLRQASSGPVLDEPLPLLKGLHAALDAFHRQRQIPALRSLVVISDGIDSTVRRSSVRDRLMAAVRLRAFVHRVRVHIVGTGDDEAALARLKQLAEACGGGFERLDLAATGAPSRAGRAVGAALRRFVLVDIELENVDAGEHDVAVTVTGDAGTALAKRRVMLGGPSTVRSHHDLEVSGVPARVMPVGVTSAATVERAARAAESAGDALNAGVLWHLAAQANPESRNAATRAETFDKKHERLASGWGKAVWNAQPVPLDLPLVADKTSVAGIWSEALGRESGLGAVVGAFPPAIVDGEPPLEPSQRQIVLHRCEAHSAAQCAHRLLAAGTYTHFFVDVAGRVSQTLDLVRRIGDPVGKTRHAIHVSFAAPPDTATTFQDPEFPETFRHLRRFIPKAEINDVRLTGWDLTDAQYRSAIPLLRGLTRFFSEIRPVLPIDQNRRETRQNLLKPLKFKGILSASNLSRSIARDPGPGVRLDRFNVEVQRWSWRGQSTDMEHWLADLADPAKQLSAVRRFEHVGPTALPLLQEVAVEMTEDGGAGAIDALAAIGDQRALPTLLLLLKKPLEAGEASIALRLATLSALVRLADDATVTIDAINGQFAEAKLLAAGHPARLAIPQAAAAALLAIGKPAFGALRGQVKHPDVVVRGQVAIGITLHGSPDDKLRLLTPLLEDKQPWIRLLAARGLGGPTAVATLLTLNESLGSEWPARELVAAGATERDVARLTDWIAVGSTASRYSLSDVLAQRPSVRAVGALAPRLTDAKPAQKRLLLRTLRKMTGRDFGSSPDGYLLWRPTPK